MYSYICVPGYSVEFSVPGENGTITNTADDNFSVKRLKIDSANTSLLTALTARFQWRVLEMGFERAGGYNDINAVTGNVEGGTMLSIQDCLPTTTEDAIITCLFYDAGDGTAGLSNQDQCTITITPTANETWMHSLALPGSAEAQKPFSRFVLSAPHDVGMNSMKACDAILHATQTEHLSKLLEPIPNVTPFKNFSPSDLLSMLPDIVYAL